MPSTHAFFGAAGGGTAGAAPKFTVSASTKGVSTSAGNPNEAMATRNSETSIALRETNLIMPTKMADSPTATAVYCGLPFSTWSVLFVAANRSRICLATSAMAPRAPGVALRATIGGWIWDGRNKTRDGGGSGSMTAGWVEGGGRQTAWSAGTKR